MERIYILGNTSSLEELGGTFIEIPKLVNEIDTHDWVVELFSDYNIDKIVIEISNDPIIAFQIAYHIRLSIVNIRKSVLIPIIFISKQSLNSVILQSGIYGQILGTKGVYFSDYDLEVNKLEIAHAVGISVNEYVLKFLKVIHIRPDETVGRHSLANIWGAYAMDKAANTNALSIDSKFNKNIYFKYVTAFNNLDKLKTCQNESEINKQDFRQTTLRGLKIIKNVSKRILLIDDEASKGWEVVLRKVFKNTRAEDFLVINEKVKDYESLSIESKNIIETQEFDLYLVDLRLNGLEEDENIKTEKFSGMKVLKKIKSINKGNQVIVFTASNKVWNLKALLDEGADDYYMKESPEYNFSNEISKQNYEDFKKNADKCIERSYLREVFSEWKKTKSNDTSKDKNFIKESDTALDIAWEQIEGNHLDFGFLTLFQSIESFANKVYSINDFNDKVKDEITIDKSDNENHKWLMTFQRDKSNGSYFTFGESILDGYDKPTALFKVSCLFKIVLHKDEAVLKKVGKLNKLRNDIAHKGAKGFANKEDLIQILKFLGEIRNT